MNENNGLGKVVERRKLIVQDSLTIGGLTAVKHANGRDWWFFAWRYEDKIVYSGLLSPAGIVIDTQILDKKFNMYGQVTITPDGTRLIRADHRFLNLPASLNIFDLDRCTGRLSNQQTHLLYEENQWFIGATVSPDSRFLYAHYDNFIYQFDLTAPDIFATQTLVGQWDGTFFFIWALDTWLGQAGPDGRLYINTSNSSFSMHRIDFPNRPGTACRFINNAVNTPTLNTREMPNFPNYRLGPLDGSPCDTLGLDNHPLARFRWEAEDSTLAPLTLTFSDLSHYNPSVWHWDFGDGTSRDTTATGEVIHTFPAPGTYNVCLSVSNQYSADTFCLPVHVGVVSSASAPATPLTAVTLAPNPAREAIYLYAQHLQNAHVQLSLFNAYGTPVLTRQLLLRDGAYISTAQLPNGIYGYRITLPDSGQIQTGKMIINH